MVIGAPVFRYYPYVSGPVLPPGCELLQVTNDPSDAGSALVGDSLLGDAKLTLEALLALVEDGSSRIAPPPLRLPRTLPSPPNSPLTASEVYAALSELRPDNAIVVQELPSNAMDLAMWWPTIKPASYYTFASGGLGWNAPAAVGIALAQKKLGTGRPVVAVIGDGSLQYSVQCLATAAQHKLKVIYIIPCNGEYAILKEFAELENTPNVPGLDLPPLDIVSTAKGFGCAAVEARTREEIQRAFSKALNGRPHCHRDPRQAPAEAARWDRVGCLRLRRSRGAPLCHLIKTAGDRRAVAVADAGPRPQSLTSSVLTKMAKIGSACGGESRDDAQFSDGAGCSDRGAAEAGQVVAISAGDALDQAEPAHATDLPGESSPAQAGDKGSQVYSAQSADVELRTLQSAEQCLLASLEEVQPFDQAIFVAAILAEPIQGANPGAMVVESGQVQKVSSAAASRMSRRSIRL